MYTSACESPCMQQLARIQPFSGGNNPSLRWHHPIIVEHNHMGVLLAAACTADTAGFIGSPSWCWDVQACLARPTTKNLYSRLPTAFLPILARLGLTALRFLSYPPLAHHLCKQTATKVTTNVSSLQCRSCALHRSSDPTMEHHAVCSMARSCLLSCQASAVPHA